VLGNLPSEAGRRALLRALREDASALVREAAAWALARAHATEPGVAPALEAAARREPEAWARAGIEASRRDP
jgi:HEAT repeat protein